MGGRRQIGKGHLSIGPSEAPGQCTQNYLLGSCTTADSMQPVFQQLPVNRQGSGSTQTAVSVKHHGPGGEEEDQEEELKAIKGETGRTGDHRKQA